MEPRNPDPPPAAARSGETELEARLHQATSRRYLASGRSHCHFVWCKLRFDPLYRALLRSGTAARGGRLLDVGCGRGISLALLDTARRAALAAAPAPWPSPAEDLELWGIELHEQVAAVARRALGGAAQILAGDAADQPLPAARTILLLDVLHYLSARDQERLLERAVEALEPGGVLIIREADAGLDLRFTLTRWAERLCALGRGHWRQQFCYRSAGEWRRLAEDAGTSVEESPMWAGTPFGNRLLQIRKPLLPAEG